MLRKGLLLTVGFVALGGACGGSAPTAPDVFTVTLSGLTQMVGRRSTANGVNSVSCTHVLQLAVSGGTATDAGQWLGGTIATSFSDTSRYDGSGIGAMFSGHGVILVSGQTGQTTWTESALAPYSISYAFNYLTPSAHVKTALFSFRCD